MTMSREKLLKLNSKLPHTSKPCQISRKSQLVYSKFVRRTLTISLLLLVLGGCGTAYLPIDSYPTYYEPRPQTQISGERCDLSYQTSSRVCVEVNRINLDCKEHYSGNRYEGCYFLYLL